LSIRPVAVLRNAPRLGVLLCGLLAGCGPADPPAEDGHPRATGEQTAESFMVAAAHPAAVEAGLAIMRRGGHAVDAAIAVQMVLGLVEPQETGPGGGGFLLYRDAAKDRVTVYDGRETAPAAAQADRFTLLGRPAPKWFAAPSGRAVGVPGLVAMLDLAHAEHGRLPWDALLAPALRLAEDGIPMPARLQRMSRRDPSLRLFADTRRNFVAPAGDQPARLRNPDYAASLRLLATQGPGALYEGPLARALVERAARRRPWPSDMTLADLRDYRATRRTPVCAPYRQWRVCGVPPPSSGGIAVLQILGMLERFDLSDETPGSAQAVHLMTEAHRLAFADRARYLGDPAFTQVPTKALLDREYLRGRAALIDAGQAMPRPRAGQPAPGLARIGAIPPEPVSGGTTHFTVADADGNIVALTSSIEAPFGSRMMVGGFLLNNQLTDFSFEARLGARTHPNAVAPGKRPRSSMSPVVVLDAQGEVRLAIGARGGPRIIAHVVKVLVGVLDWKLPIQEAIDLPNFVHAERRLELEAGAAPSALHRALERRGHRVREVALESGLHGVERHAGGWRGGADRRLDGAARGE